LADKKGGKMNRIVDADAGLRLRISTLRWTLPFVLGFLAVIYEIGPGRWIHDELSATFYFDIDIAFYGLVVPLLAFAVLSLLHHWFYRKDLAEKHAKASERRLAAIVTASADAIIGLDAAGHIESWNRGAELLFEYPASAAIGEELSSVFGGGTAAKMEFRWLTFNVQQTGYIRGHETTFRSRSGKDISIDLTATQLAVENGQPCGMSLILRDVTERKHREEEIHRLNTSLNEQVALRTRELADKVEQLATANAELQKLDQMRSEFVSLLAHQLRAPLTNMRGAVERMGNDCALVNMTCTRMFQIMEQQASRLDRLVSDVLTTTRLEAGELMFNPEPMSVMPVVQQIVEQNRARIANRHFHIPPRPGLPLVLADRDRVAEVLSNLLDNADKYSPQGKDVVIDIRADQVEVIVSVHDSGSGLPPEDFERVFEKFYRADNSDSQAAYGYGLGLYVCRQLVKAQGGRIWAENAVDGGAVFSFTLPIALES
jgi:PAS domain S-box-containing protein